MEENNGNFLDSKTVLAIALVAVVFFGWQSYLSHKYPNMNKPAVAAAATTTTLAPTGLSVGKDTVNSIKPGSDIALQNPEKILTFQSDNLGFEISSRGMAVQKIELKKYFDRDHKTIILSADNEASSFGTGVLGDPVGLDFSIERNGESSFLGTATTSQGVRITKLIEVDASRFVIKSKIAVENLQIGFPGISVAIGERRSKVVASSFLMPPADIQEATVKFAGKEERVVLSSNADPISHKFDSASVVAIGNHYFAAGIVDKSEITPDILVSSNAAQDHVFATLNYKLPTQKEKVEITQIGYIGPKSLKLLQDADKEFEILINYGMFASIARVLLGIMKWFYSILGNWGFSIVCLTLLVRLFVLPFNMASYKSMKKMQKIQPLLQTIRERYKDDPQAMNKETMSLMKEQKVNPLGGCLPMLLQMPIFFALYQVFGQSIELYQAPFIFWIKDLSLKDPFYVLPVLMMIAMFLQQKLTPTTMDPAQAKIMQWLPLVFGMMMVALPSGLTLYIFISTIFGVVQQQVFIKDRKTSVIAQEAKA